MSPREIKVVRVITRLNVGGPAIHVVELTAGLDPRRFRSLLVSGTEAPEEGSLVDLALSRGIRMVRIPELAAEARFTPRDVAAVLKLLHLLRRERPDIVHTHTAKAGFVGRIAAWLAGVPVVVHTFHGHILRGYYGPAMSLMLRQMERTLARLTDQIITVSDRVRQDLIDLRIAPPAKITVVPLGLRLDPFLSAERQQGRFRRELGFRPEHRLVGIVGRLYPIKNHDLFLQAAARVAAQDPAVRFVVVGDGPRRPAIERGVQEHGLAGRVVLTGWRRDLPEIYSDLDVLVISSDNEGTPVSAIEAMASGCPVVGTRVGGMPDLIVEGETGLLVPPRDPDALAQAILRMLRDASFAARAAEAARAAVHGRYALPRLIADIEGLYLELVPERVSSA